ncbi:MAG: branched-chain amino acid ABC transporter permease [Alphaproteobacteria bacterium]
MSPEFLQFLISGVTVGAIYALVGVGFSIIFNASQVINFAQGEFVMIGGMATVSLVGLGFPLPLAILLAVLVATAIGMILEKLAIEPTRDAEVVTLIIITIGASIFLRGAAQVVWGRNFHSLTAFSGETPIIVGGAALLPQSVWIVGVGAVIVLALSLFFNRTLLGKSMRATSFNPLAARLVGINTRRTLLASFALAAALGAVAGILIAPVSLTYANVGVMLGLKGFSAAIVGGLGNPMGAVAGGLLVGIAEAMTAGYISSAYKDAVAFVIILAVLFFLPNGIFGGRGKVEKV